MNNVSLCKKVYWGEKIFSIIIFLFMIFCLFCCVFLIGLPIYTFITEGFRAGVTLVVYEGFGLILLVGIIGAGQEIRS